MLPVELIDPANWRARHDWLRARGVDPGDWPRVRQLLAESRTFHGLQEPPRRYLSVQDDGEPAR